MKDYYTVKEYADKLQVSPNTVRNWIRKGIIDTEQKFKLGKIFINKLEVPAFMREKEDKNEKS